MKKLNYLLIAISIFYGSCNSGTTNDKPIDTPTTGHITIGTDETLFPLASSEVKSFETLCPKANIDIKSGVESDIYTQLLDDSVRMILVTREPSKEEFAFFENRKMKLRVNNIAKDGVAFITNNSNPDTISYENIIKILTGEITTWNQWNSKLSSKPIQLVFDNANSSTVKHVLTHTQGKLYKNVSALENNQKVIDYIKENKYAIGIIGLNWISDGRDRTTGSFYEGFKVMGINPADTSKNHGNYFKPFQAYLYYNAYPFHRTIYSINAEPREGLGTGFVSFLCSQKGQTVVQQGGLLPMAQRAWIREIEIKK
jgi:phosphate transport system substrate-binding protein